MFGLIILTYYGATHAYISLCQSLPTDLSDDDSSRYYSLPPVLSILDYFGQHILVRTQMVYLILLLRPITPHFFFNYDK